MKIVRKSIVAIAMAVVVASCASHKGSSSLGSSTKTTVSSSTPKVKSDAQLAAEKEAAEQEALKARRQAEAEAANAKAAAEAKAAEAEAKAKAALEEAAAKAAAEEARLAAEAKAREEKVRVVESKSISTGKFYVVIGSYKSLNNARVASDQAISEGFTPSIMENEDGMYRVSVFNVDAENVARARLAKVKMKYPAYSDAWLLIKK